MPLLDMFHNYRRDAGYFRIMQIRGVDVGQCWRLFHGKRIKGIIVNAVEDNSCKIKYVDYTHVAEATSVKL